MNSELPQYSDAATYIELTEASFRLLKSGKRPHAIVFGPPETEGFDGNEHYNYVQDIFGALGGCDPENLDDLADSLDMLIDEDDPHRPEWYLLCKLSEEHFMALQLAALF